MANSLIIKIDGDASGYQKELNKVKDGVSEVNKIAKAVAVAATATTAAVVGMGVKYNAEMEQYKAGFSTMLGSAEKANKTISDLKEFAKKTPFEMTDLANASTTLLAFGEDSKNLMDDLKILGDISLGNSEKFKSLALVFGQVQSQGKLMGQDLLQMINSGFNPLQVLADKTGKSMSALKDEMSQGKISFEMVAEAMRAATSEGGQFYNAMETQSKTLTGQFSTLKDNVTALLGEMTSALSEDLSEDVMPWLIEQVEALNKAWEDGRLEEYIKGTAVALSAFGTAVISLNIAMFVNDIYSLKKGVDGFTAATKLGTTAQKLMNLELIKNPYTLAAMALATLTAAVVTYAATHKSKATEVIDSLDSMSKSYEDLKKSTEETTAAELARIGVVANTIPRLEELANKTNRTTAEEQEFKGIIDGLNQAMPDLQLAIDNETGALNMQISTVWRAVEAYQALAKAKALEELTVEAEKNRIQAQKYYDDNADGWKADIAANPGLHENFFVQMFTGWIPDEHEAGQDAYNALIAAESAIDKYTKEAEYYSVEWNALQQEAAKALADVEGARKVVGGTGVGTSTSTSSSALKAGAGKQNQAKAYKKAVEDEIDAELHKFKILKYQGEITQADYLEKIKERSHQYRAYAEEVLAMEAFSAEEREEINKEWIKKAEDIEASYLRNCFQQDKEYLEKQKKAGVISQEEYWVALAKLRDKYFSEGSDAWFEYSDEIAEMQKASFEEIANAQDKLAEKLKGSASIFSKSTFIGEDNPDILFEEGTKTSLRNFEKENEALLAYRDAIGKLKERSHDILGEDFSKFFSIFAEMSVAEGTEAVNTLLGASDDRFRRTLEGWKEYQENSDVFASEFYKDDFAELREAFEGEWGQLPDTFFDIGKESMQQFGDGFIAPLQTLLDDVKSQVESSLRTLFGGQNVSVNASNQQREMPSNTTTNNYSVYNLTASENTVSEQLRAIRQEEETKKLRGG